MDPNNQEQRGIVVNRADLNEWDKNSKDITKDGYDRTREQIEKKGQYKPLLITKIEGIWIILGGHTRWKIYSELGVEWLWCSVVEFFQNENGIWKARVNGVEAADTYDSREQGMAEYSLSDNDNSGFYVEEKVKMNFAPLNIKGSYGLTIAPPPTLEELLKSKEEGDGSKDGEDYKGEFQVVVDCKSEEEQERVYNQLQGLGLECKVLTL